MKDVIEEIEETETSPTTDNTTLQDFDNVVTVDELSPDVKESETI